MKPMIRPLCLAFAVLLVAVPAHAFPDRPTYEELLKVDLPEQIADSDLSVVVMMPASCFGTDKTIICKQFRQYQPEDKPAYAYAVAESTVPKLASVPAQVAALPDAMRQRRFVVLLDWEMHTVPSTGAISAQLYGELVVYDQQQKKVVWHSLAYSATPTLEKYIGDAARFYLFSVGDVIHYRRMLDHAAAKGIGVRGVDAGAQGEAGYNLLVFNSRNQRGDSVQPSTARINIESGPGATRYAPMSFSMPESTYVALRLPQGKYRLEHDYKAEIEVEIGAQPKAYQLTGRDYGKSKASEVDAKTLALLSGSMRNLLLPDPAAREHYRGPLAWSDAAAEPAMPAPNAAAAAANAAADAAVAAAMASAGAPVRATRSTARIRFYGYRGGHRMEFYQPSMCYRGGATGTDVTMGEGSTFGGMFAKSRSVSIGMPERPRTLAIKSRPKSETYYREFEIAANQPLTIGMSEARKSGDRIYKCETGASLMPLAGADYEADFRMTDAGCFLIVKEIGLVDSVVTEYPVEVARAPVCK